MTPRPAGGVLGHRCRCGHPDLWHKEDPTGRGVVRGRCGSAGCPCIAASWPAAPSVINPAYDSTTGERISYVIPPGTTEHGLRSCACESCLALYAAVPVGEQAEHPCLFEEAG
jgi:hypothetical protein